MASTVTVNIDGPIATITLNRPEILNALFPEDYDAFAETLYEIDKNPDVVVTVWQGYGRFFCSGTRVDGTSKAPIEIHGSVRREQVAKMTRITDCSRALYTHSKILIAILNGPAMGIAAAYLGHFDFIYASPTAWIAVPFANLGIVAEVGASVTFAQRMGLSKAKEILMWGKKATAEDLLQSRFVNKIFYPTNSSIQPRTVEEHVQASKALHDQVRTYLLDDLSLLSLDGTSLLRTKYLLKTATEEQNNSDAANLRESTEQVARFLSGEPSKRFGEIARKERRHKL